MLKQIFSSLVLAHIALAASHHRPPIDGRIVGGDETIVADYPYQVSIQYEGVHQCAGAIISRIWILTAAHCVNRQVSPEYFTVRVGTSFRELGGTVIGVSTILLHSNYSSVTYDFNIAVLQLQEPVILSEFVQIVGLPDNGDSVPQGTMASVAGWGATIEGGVNTSILRAIQIPVVDYSVCRDVYTNLGYIFTERMFCAGAWDGSMDACTGDGGGALVSNWRVIGLVSWGSGCANPQRPGVYTNVGVLRDWITENTGI